MSHSRVDARLIRPSAITVIADEGCGIGLHSKILRGQSLIQPVMDGRQIAPTGEGAPDKAMLLENWSFVSAVVFAYYHA